MKKIRVVVVDDSALVRGVLSQLINASPDLRVVGEAADANAAREAIRLLHPDVVTLDVRMRGISGPNFLDHLIGPRPTTVLIVSDFSAGGSESSLRGLELGAFDLIRKPRLSDQTGGREYALELNEKLRAATRVKAGHAPRVARAIVAPPAVASPSPLPPPRPLGSGSSGASGKIVFLGASTGGTEAIKIFLEGLPADCPPILIVQHMPEMFTGSFAKRLDGLCAPRVIESQGGEAVTPGTVYIAPGHSHLLIRKAGSGYCTELSQTPPVNRHRPSVDVLFDSAAAVVGRNALGVLLTGMGKDGAEGLCKMRQAGARTFAQDEASCVVFGMPREAILRHGVDEIVPLSRMAGRVLGALNER